MNFTPKISVIIPIYNCQDSIEYSINSILNQNFTNYEILLINDFSNDKSLLVITHLSNIEPRIKIMNNYKNMGTLYSRCIGVLKSKGEYILSLDNDDLFMRNDLFSITIKEMEKGKYDILELHAIRGRSYKPHISEMNDDIFHQNENNLILNQPELSYHSVTKNGSYGFNNIHIWGKCINKRIYKLAINLIDKEKYYTYICWAEDTLMVYILFNIANSYKFINIYSVFHLESIQTTGYTQSFSNKTFGEIFLLDIIYRFSKNNLISKLYTSYKALEIGNNDFYSDGIRNYINKIYFKNILNEIIQCKYISTSFKYLIRRNYINLRKRLI